MEEKYGLFVAVRRLQGQIFQPQQQEQNAHGEHAERDAEFDRLRSIDHALIGAGKPGLPVGNGILRGNAWHIQVRNLEAADQDLQTLAEHTEDREDGRHDDAGGRAQLRHDEDGDRDGHERVSRSQA